jgi:hypothetical protein
VTPHGPHYRRAVFVVLPNDMHIRLRAIVLARKCLPHWSSASRKILPANRGGLVLACSG